MRNILGLLLFFPIFVLAGELSDEFYNNHVKFDQANSASRDVNDIILEKHGIIEIGLEMPGCYGTCATYTVIIKNDGTFKYTGFRYVKKIGEHVGTVSKPSLRALLQFIDESEYFSFENEYSDDRLFDAITVFTMVKTKNDKKTIRNYDQRGPMALWAIEELIARLLSGAKWGHGGWSVECSECVF